MKQSLLGLLAASLVFAPLAQAKIIYDNSDKPEGKSLSADVEFGDQVILDTGFYPTAKLNSFIFEYFGVNFSGNEEMRVRMYKNDGLNGKPGSLIFDSQPFEIPETATGASVDLGDLGLLVVPKNFTWTVTFTGVDTASGESAGLNLYGPPIVGSGFSDYWERSGNDWALKSIPGADASFAAFIDGVPVIPEPSTLVLSAVGMVLLGSLARRK